jgi:hypothetical protein
MLWPQDARHSGDLADARVQCKRHRTPSAAARAACDARHALAH